MSNFPSNDEMFAQVKKLDLPRNEYAITSSGPLGIRGIRKIGDIDMVVSAKLWDKLALEYGVTTLGEYKKIVVSPDIDAFCEESFPNREANAPTVEQQIKEAEEIKGLMFVNLRHVLYFKETMGREKDASDIAIIRSLLNNAPHSSSSK